MAAMGFRCFAPIEPDTMHAHERMSILHHSADGYVGTCCSCGRLQVAFGTSVFHVNEHTYRELLDELGADERYGAKHIDPRTKCFVYDVGDGSMRLVLNHHEVCRLRAMLADSLWMQGVMEMAGDDVS